MIFECFRFPVNCFWLFHSIVSHTEFQLNFFSNKKNGTIVIVVVVIVIFFIFKSDTNSPVAL